MEKIILRRRHYGVENAMANEKMQALLERLPDIAKAVNEFKSEDLQKKAFDALMLAAGISTPEPLHTPVQSDEKPKPRKKNAATDKKENTPKPKGRTFDRYQIVDVDLHPEGKPSLKDFFAEKSPHTDPEKYVCIIYYLKNIVGSIEVTPDHIFTAFKQLGLKVPNIGPGLNNTRGRHGWIDFKGDSPLQLTRIGENFVEHDMPAKKAFS